jgi:hypothetical protein
LGIRGFRIGSKVCALWWLFAIELYLAQHGRGIPILAVRYTDLNAHREEARRKVFTYCDLPVSKVKEALKAFERDAQAGTPLAREDAKQGNTLRLSDEQLADVYDVLQRHPIIKTPDFRLPGTLTL